MLAANIFTDHKALKAINYNFEFYISLVKKTYPPCILKSISPESQMNCENDSDIVAEFIGANSLNQIEILTKVRDLSKIFRLLNDNVSSYNNDYFLDELFELSKKNVKVRSHLSFHIESFLLYLSVVYKDDLRYKAFKILLLLIDEKKPDNKENIVQLNRIFYECLYDFDIYYETIKPFTMETIIIPLTKDDIHLLLKDEIQNDLKEKISIAIKNLGGHAFFKMHRSPKDAFSLIETEIKGDWKKNWYLEDDENPKTHFMKIKHVNQIMKLCKFSNRIQDDLKNFATESKLILRKWEALGQEFRCFVCNHNLNAVSSYNQEKPCILEQEELEKFINSSRFKETILIIPYSHAVIDVCIDKNYDIKIIEINPFGKVSSAAKFSWTLDNDLLTQGYTINNEKVILKL